MLNPSSPLFTDLYQLTMMQSYRQVGLDQRYACFDLFFRRGPFGGGYAVWAGINDALDYLATTKFLPAELDYLRSLKLFDESFIAYLKDFRFKGDIYSLPEGTIVFPYEPLMRIQGPLADCQLVETAILNIVNFQTLIATKAARICREAGEDNVMEFGLRRAQGRDGGLHASRAAYLGGCKATSNVEAGQLFDLPVCGTHSHAWVMAHEDELTAFRHYVAIYPHNSVLLVDTYDTLKSGVPHAITVAQELKAKGLNLMGIRLDSGDLAYLSRQARQMLDAAGFNQVKIIVSGDLDEWIVRDLRQQGACIDSYGIGTKLVTGQDDPSLTGVYKLSALQNPDHTWQLCHKIAEGGRKSTFPGLKQIWRLTDKQHHLMGDVIELEGIDLNAQNEFTATHPFDTYQKIHYQKQQRGSCTPLLTKVMDQGKILMSPENIHQCRQKIKQQLNDLDPTFTRLLNPHIYKVSLGPELFAITNKMRGRHLAASTVQNLD